MLRIFPPKVKIRLDIEKFNDEEVNAEAFIELLSYYNIEEVNLERCVI